MNSAYFSLSAQRNGTGPLTKSLSVAETTATEVPDAECSAMVTS